MALPGPLGSDSNLPIIDEGTLARIAHAAPEVAMFAAKKLAPYSKPRISKLVHTLEVSTRQLVAQGYKAFGEARRNNAALLHPEAQALVSFLHAMQDEYAQEIFDHWFYATGAPLLVLDTERWGNYMRAEPNLPGRIYAALTRLTGKLLAQTPTKPNKAGIKDSFSYQCDKEDRMEVGPPDGGYMTGYEVLHGVNRDVGGFQISGNYTVEPRGSLFPNQYTVVFTDVRYVFNDIVDPKLVYKTDEYGEIGARNVAEALCVGPPESYTVQIKWRALAPIRVVAMKNVFLPTKNISPDGQSA
jgi:hypothetical protein